MTEPEREPPVVQFALNPASASKRPEQLVRLLEASLEREFPTANGVIDISHSDDGVVTVHHLDALEGDVAEKLAHRARVVYNDFMISPWY